MSTATRNDTAVWTRIDEHANDLHQTRAWAELDLAMSPGEPVALECRTRHGTVWLPTVRRPVGDAAALFSPYGYPGLVHTGDLDDVDVDEFLDVLAERVRAAGAYALFVRLHPLHDGALPPVDRPDAATVTHGPTATIDLRDGSDAAWAATRSRSRSYIRRLRRDGFTTRLDHWDEDFDAFRGAYDESMARHDAAGRYRFDDRYWDRLRRLGADHTLLVTVREPGGEVVAGSVCTRWGDVANYHLGGTRSAFLDRHLLELMLWTAAEALAPETRLLHLGGGVGAARDGLFQLKRGLGRLERPFRTLRLIADDEVHRRIAGDGSDGVRAEPFPPTRP